MRPYFIHLLSVLLFYSVGSVLACRHGSLPAFTGPVLLRSWHAVPPNNQAKQEDALWLKIMTPFTNMVCHALMLTAICGNTTRLRLF